MSQYSRRGAGNGGNGGYGGYGGGYVGKFVEEEEYDLVPQTNSRSGGNGRVGLGIQERLPLPSGQKPMPSTQNQYLSQGYGYSPRQQDGYNATGLQQDEYSEQNRSGPNVGGNENELDLFKFSEQNAQPRRARPRYNRPNEFDQEIDATSLMVSPTIGSLGTPSMQSSRSILIGYDDSLPAVSNGNNAYLNFPAPSQRNTAVPQPPPPPPPSARRGAPSTYFSHPSIVVSPIPEESPNSNPRHGSYASSHVIPSAWGGGGEYSYPEPSDYFSEEDEYRNRNQGSFGDDDRSGLVRQASLGRKSKPVLTEIRSPSRQDSVKKSIKKGGMGKQGSTTSPTTASESSGTASPVTPFALPAITDFEAVRKEAEHLTVPMAAKSRNHTSVSSSVYSIDQYQPPLRPVQPLITGSRRKGPPPVLNLAKVRDAEARGSLTSLPDLIRRATKLAAVLENGKPVNGSGDQGSFANSRTSSNRRTDSSISDILASFPPPALASTKNRASRTISSWPMPSEFHEVDGHSSFKRSQKQRRVCGLPIWAFILLVILALLVIAAAIIVPLQLVTLSRNQESNGADRNAQLLRQCRASNPCENGGETIASRQSCGCVCTGGFSGKNCSVPPPPDNSCVTMDLDSTQQFGVTLNGIQNATMGASVRRILMISNATFDIILDANRMLSALWAADISCTAQNALITFNGKSVSSGDMPRRLPRTVTIDSFVTPLPTVSASIQAVPRAIARQVERRAPQGLIIDTTTSSAPTTTAVRTIDLIVSGPAPTMTPTTTLKEALDFPTKVPSDGRPIIDDEILDFSRVAILFLVYDQGLGFAVESQVKFQRAFSNSIDFGVVDLGGGVSVDFNVWRISLPGGRLIGRGVGTNFF